MEIFTSKQSVVSRLSVENEGQKLYVRIQSNDGRHFMVAYLDDGEVAELGGVLLGYSMGREARGAELLAAVAAKGGAAAT